MFSNLLFTEKSQNSNYSTTTDAIEKNMYRFGILRILEKY
jgi:hypothetical protein